MNRRIASLLVPSVFFFVSGVGQINAQKKENASLYQLSLMAYVEAKAVEAGTSNNIVVLDNSVLHDSHVTETFPLKIGSATVEYLTAKSITERHKRSGKDFPIVEILPMRNSNGLLVIGCAEYRVNIRHGKLDLGVFGGYEISWRFDCSKAEYVRVKVERWNALTL